jgi:hypothetical protein
MNTILSHLLRIAEKAGLVEKIKPPGKPLSPCIDEEVLISDEEVDAAIAEWNAMWHEAGLPPGILQARIASPEEQVG